ncbi:E3 ubiquitin-protein ligase RNF186 [Xenopus tropicalis]|uniref:E3 ubiquitin-protein ligase RNF186 n=1 Tax=Xenopus tropicalis TaxID=8364 RepID=A0A6I8QI27_XENTR|nr:E3 ubiquitin-protein ligase RNF186 [Xenopus tropicalis]
MIAITGQWEAGYSQLLVRHLHTEGNKGDSLVGALYWPSMMDSADPIPIAGEEPACECCSSNMDPNSASKQASAVTPCVDLPSAEQAADIGSGTGLRGVELCIDQQKPLATNNLPPSIANQDAVDPEGTDMDCPVCFSKYDIYRTPKELSCRHTFCIVCLKLLLHHEKDAWLIPCPICRCSTTVFGGLICTLPNKESLMSRLEDSGLPQASQGPEVSISMNCGSHHVGIEDGHDSVRMAAQRLAVLLLILLILLIIILQFVYSGILNWVLGFILGLVAIVALLLCFGPNCKVKLPIASATQEKDNHPTV